LRLRVKSRTFTSKKEYKSNATANHRSVNYPSGIIAPVIQSIVGKADADGRATRPIKGPYVMIRLDRLTGAVRAFNWAGWVKVKPQSGYPGTETPK